MLFESSASPPAHGERRVAGGHMRLVGGVGRALHAVYAANLDDGGAVNAGKVGVGETLFPGMEGR